MSKLKLSEQQLEIFLDIASEAVLAAGIILQTNLGKLKNIQEKGCGDLVTEVDKEAEVEIIRVLKRHFPTHSILAEESGQFTSTESEYLWAVDPLDGTTNYAHGYPVACVSVGLIIEGVPQIGAVYNPFRQELFRAATGLGATLNRLPIKVSLTNQLSQSLLLTGFAYDRRETPDNNYREFCHLTHLTQGVRRSGSAAIDLTDVACGRIDGYWERGLKPWDIAAGVVILQEAGGKVTAYDQSPLVIESGRVLATNSWIHAELSNVLLEAKDSRILT